MDELLLTYPSADKLRKAGQARFSTLMARHAPRAGNRWTTDLFAALDEQTVVGSGTGAASIVLRQLAGMLKQLPTARDEDLTQVEELVEAHPLHVVLTSMPAGGARTEAHIITEVSVKEFKSAGHLASYAGLAPVPWRSGTSIRGDHPPRKATSP